MAKIEKITTIRVKNDLFDFDELCSFRTKSFVGERTGECAYGLDEFIIFDTENVQYISDRINKIYVVNLEDLVEKVEYYTNEEIIEVYDEHIATINIDIPM